MIAAFRHPPRGARRRVLVTMAVVLAALPWLAGCGVTRRVAVGSMVDIIDEAAAAAWASRDPELVREAVPANLLLIEGLIRSDPRDELLILSAQFHFSYAFAFIEDQDPDRARALYAAGRDRGLRVLRKHQALRAAFAAHDLDGLARALERLDRDDVPALFWTTTAWAAWINVSLESAAAIADLPLVEVMLERVLALDETYQWGMPQLMMGAFYAGRPPLLGGDPERGRSHFERARAISGGRLLLASLFEARYYAVQTLDQELFERRLREVLAAPADILPEAALLNVVAQAKARDLLAAEEDLF